jgi:RES domain-containing protein
LNFDALPFNRYLVAIDVPRAQWDAAVVLDPTLLIGWDALPPGRISLDAGDAWAAENVSLLCRVPSVIVPREQNVLINPRHKDVDTLTFRKLEKWTYDSRFSASMPYRKSPPGRAR